jgi:hypothetical protein
MRIVSLVVAATIALAACGPSTYVASAPADPCEPSYYNAPLCQQALAQNGFYYQGAFVPHIYVNPFAFYSTGYSTYRQRGGRVYSVSPSYYSRSYSTPSSSVYRNNPRTTYRPSTVPGTAPSVVNPTARAATPRTTVVSPRSSYSSPSRSTYSSPSRSSSSSSSSRRRR